MAVHLRGAIVDAEGADVAEYPLDDRIRRHAHAAENLERAVDDAEDRLRADDLGHRTRGRSAVPLVEQPCGVPDRETRRVDIERVVGEHERYALVIAERLAEGMAAPRVLGRDVVGADRRA